MSQNELDDLLNYTLQEMAKKAKENQLITYEEFDIMKQVRYDVKRYQNALIKALDDRIITSEENLLLTKLKDDILKNAVTVANFDSIVDNEEQGLVKTITKIVKTYFTELEDSSSKM